MRRPGSRRRKARALESARATLRARFDALWPLRGPCAFCGPVSLGNGRHGFHDARHRLVDAIRSRHRAGDSVRALVDDYLSTERAIRMVLETSLQ